MSDLEEIQCPYCLKQVENKFTKGVHSVKCGYCDFKNAEVIDSNVKERILNQLEQLRVDSHCVEIKEGFSEERICSTEFEKAIKIISKLKEK